MPTLRAMVDGQTLETMKAATPSAKPSPAAKHVAEHVQDPFGQTKDDFDDLNQSRMDYETKKQNMRMKLAPVQSVLTGIKNMHQLDGPGDGSPLDMSPNNPMNTQPQIDPNTGLPIPQTPNDPGAQIDDGTGVPQNMMQGPGQQMNMNRPSQAGFQPGVSPGPAESVRPGKMGTPQAGQGGTNVAGNPNPKNMPAGWTKPGSGGTGNQPGQYNPGAPPPKGAGSLPGAKGPGDPKVANRTKKAQANSGGGSGRSVHVEVRADSNMTRPAVSTVARAAATDALRMPMRGYGKTPKGINKDMRDVAIAGAGPCPKCGKVHAGGVKACNYMKAVGTSEGATKGWEERGLQQRRGNFGDQPIGPNKWKPWSETHPPTGRGAGALRKEKQERGKWKPWSETHPPTGKKMEAREFSEGHRMKAGGPGSGRRPGGFVVSKQSKIERAVNSPGKFGPKMKDYQMLPKRSDLRAREFSTGERKKLAKTGAAMPGGGFPITNKQDLANARQAIGRAKNPSAAKAHIAERAKALGLKARIANLTQ